MRRDIGQLKAEHFDILVIGGGINGCAIARDATLRGAKVALIEKDDFASGASGKTTKLIHGGIRYLEQFNFRLVYEALHERAILLRTAPHLIKPLEFIIPVYKHDPRSLLKIRTGVFIYEKLAGGENIHPHRTLNKNEVVSLEQNIDSRDLKGAVLYYDAQMDDIRLCLDNAISAFNAGACVANKTEVLGFIKDKGKITAIETLDKLTGEKFVIRASIVINATGAWSNQVVKMDEPDTPAITRPTKGIHIIYRKLPHQRAILISARKDKRILFIIPWRDYTLIGTTDTDYRGSADEVYATSDEIEYLLTEARRIFPEHNLERKGIITTFASLRPLINPVRDSIALCRLPIVSNGVNTQDKPPWQVSREHLIRESRAGLISVVGGKYTTYRRLAEQVVDLALAKINPSTTLRIDGERSRTIKGRNFKKCITQTVELSSPTSLGNKMDLPKLIEYAVKEEMANSLTDLLARRLQFFTTPEFGFPDLKECADIMAGLLRWTDAQKEQEMHMYKEEVRKNTNF